MHANSTPLSLDTPNTFGDVVVIFSVGRGGSGWFCQVVQNTDPQNKCKLENELFGQAKIAFQQKTGPPLSEMLTYFKEMREKYHTGDNNTNLICFPFTKLILVHINAVRLYWVQVEASGQLRKWPF